MSNTVIHKRKKLETKVRSRVKSRKDIMRLSVYRSSQHIYVQAIDDAKGVTVAAASDLGIKKDKKAKIVSAKEVGKEIAKKLLDKKINSVVFDRGGFKYAGRVKALCEAVRENGVTI